jgi:PqqD family protein of HPr-rel-A system
VAGPRWIADPPELIRLVPLDGLAALFHRPSGLTHILAAPAPQILFVLADGAADADSILERISARFEISADDAAASIAARLAELEAAGLVRRA